MSTTLQVRQKGVLTLPVELRRRYNIADGDVLTLIEIGDGAFMLVPIVSQVARLGDQAAQALAESNVPLDDILHTLDDERRQYYRKHYAKA